IGPPLITGAPRSIWTLDTDAAVSLPALSFTVTGPAPRLRPSPVITLSAGWVAGSMPDRPSAPVQWMVTSPLYQPAFGSVVASPRRVGWVRSMLIPPTVVLAVLPTPSTAVPVTAWLAPS